jgi:hypothetical protein
MLENYITNPDAGACLAGDPPRHGGEMTERRVRTIGTVVDQARRDADRSGRAAARRWAERARRRWQVAQAPGLAPERRRTLLLDSERSALRVLARRAAA